MSAQREPTVIERMAAKAHNNSASFRAWSHLDAESRACCCDDMLAAVRELYETSLDASGVWSQYGYLKHIIQEHERRAGGKGE